MRHRQGRHLCTTVEGVRGERAKEWRLVDQVIKTAGFRDAVRARALELAAKSKRPGATAGARGVLLPRLERIEELDGAVLRYRYVEVTLDRSRGTATLVVKAPSDGVEVDVAKIEGAGAAWWPVQMARELDDAILHLRTNELEVGTWVLKATGEAKNVLAVDAALVQHADHWFVRQALGLLRRTFARLDVSSRSLLALIEPASCFAGCLAELAFAADRTYMTSLPTRRTNRG